MPRRHRHKPIAQLITGRVPKEPGSEETRTALFALTEDGSAYQYVSVHTVDDDGDQIIIGAWDELSKISAPNMLSAVLASLEPEEEDPADEDDDTDDDEEDDEDEDETE